MSYIELGQTFVEEEPPCPQCTWFVDTDLSMERDFAGAAATLTVSKEKARTEGVEDITIFKVIVRSEADARRLSQRKRGAPGSNTTGAVRLHFHSIEETPLPRRVRIDTSTIDGNPIYTVHL